MCGLVGIGDFGIKIGQLETELFTQMLVADSLRGTHGTGIVKVFSNGKTDWRKIEGDPYVLLRAAGIPKFMSEHNKSYIRFLLGHNRSATTGDKSTSCAHPFEIGKITLMHNGTLYPSSRLPDFESFKVDSQAICNSIDIQGIEKTVEQIRGAYALVYYDSKAKQLNLIRNADRPLYYAINEQMGRVYFASEASMLRWIFIRNGIQEDKAKIVPLPEHMLLTFDVGKYKKYEKDLSKAVYSSSYYGRRSHYLEDDNDDVFQDWEYNAVKGVWEPRKQALKKPSFVLIEDKTKENKKKKEEKERKSSPGMTDFLRPIGVLTSADDLFGYKVQDSISFQIADYRETSEAKSSFIAEGFCKELPNLTLYMFIPSAQELDLLLEAPAVRGTIRSMQWNIDTKINKAAKHRMWVFNIMPDEKKEEGCIMCKMGVTHDARDCENTQKDILEDDITDIDEKEIIADLNKEQSQLNKGTTLQ